MQVGRLLLCCIFIMFLSLWCSLYARKFLSSRSSFGRSGPLVAGWCCERLIRKGPSFAVCCRFPSPIIRHSSAILGRFFTLLDAFFFFFNYNFRLPFYRPSSIDWTWILEGFFGDSSNYSMLFAMFDYQFGSSPSDWTRILEDSLGVLQPLDAVFFFSICSITILGHCSLIRPGFLRILDDSWGLLRD